jgi:hypothetical protein
MIAGKLLLMKYDREYCAWSGVDEDEYNSEQHIGIFDKGDVIIYLREYNATYCICLSKFGISYVRKEALT